MTRSFYTNDEEGHQQQELDRLNEEFDRGDLFVAALGVDQAYELMFAQREPREFAKMEFYESRGYWPTDEELDRSGIPIRPLPGSPSV